MYSFRNDYSEGAHPQILDSLIITNFEQTDGYGEDKFCKYANKLIKEKIKNDNVDIHYIPGGTHANLTAIGAFLRPHEACISANTGHIYSNETGSIEATGHKIISVDSKDGKLKGSDILDVVKKYSKEHLVKPKLVYISNSTEVGTIYLKSELEDLSKACRENDLILFMDGARLGSALCTKSNDLDLNTISRLTDAFYIGGTKNGALFGEALVICKDSLKEDFRYHLKQRGAMLAKGRILGVQFAELFKENLFFEIGNHENEMADILREGIDKCGYKCLIDTDSNQIFPIFPNEVIKKLSQKYDFGIWSEINENTSSIRLVTSWATDEKMTREFVKDLQNM